MLPEFSVCCATRLNSPASVCSSCVLVSATERTRFENIANPHLQCGCIRRRPIAIQCQVYNNNIYIYIYITWGIYSIPVFIIKNCVYTVTFLVNDYSLLFLCILCNHAANIPCYSYMYMCYSWYYTTNNSSLESKRTPPIIGTGIYM